MHSDAGSPTAMMTAIPPDVEPIPGRLARLYARRYEPLVGYDDLFQVGWMSLQELLNAAGKRPIRNLAGYASTRIRRAICGAIADEMEWRKGPSTSVLPGHRPSGRSADAEDARRRVEMLLGQLSAISPLHAEIVRHRDGIDRPALDGQEIAYAVHLPPGSIARQYQRALDLMRALARGETPAYRPCRMLKGRNTPRREELAGEIVARLREAGRPLTVNELRGVLPRAAYATIQAALGDLIGRGCVTSEMTRVARTGRSGRNATMTVTRHLQVRVYRLSSSWGRNDEGVCPVDR